MEKRRNLLFIFLCLIILGFTVNVSAAVLDWKYYETDDFIVFYPKGYEWQGTEVLYYLEKYQSEVREVTGNSAQFKTTVVLQDMGNESNGMADPITTKIDIYTNNPSTYAAMSGLENGHSWLRSVSVHEFTHISQMTNTSGTVGVLARLFGNAYSTNSAPFIPLWMVEGITVYQESQLSPYEGRLNTGYYDALIATKAKENKLPSISEATYPHNHYPRGQWYLYGGEFFEYLGKEYGEDKLAEYFKLNGSDTSAPYGIFFPSLSLDNSAKTVYGKGFPDLFEDWKEEAKQNYQSWQVDGQQVLENKSGRIYNLLTAHGKIYYLKELRLTSAPFNSKRNLALTEYDPSSDQEKVLKLMNSSSATSMQIVGDKIYYSLLDFERGFANLKQSGRGTLGVLYSYDLTTGKSHKIFRDDFKDFVVLATGEIIYSKDNKEEFGSELWSYSYKGKEKLAVTEELISEIRAYRDRFIVVAKQRVGSWNINYLDLEQDKVSLEPIIKTPYTEEFIKVIGDKIYFTANYDDHHSVYSYDLLSKRLAQITTGAYSVDGIPYQDKYYFVSLTADGEGVYRKNLDFKSVAIPEVEEERALNIDFGGKFKGESAGLKSLSYLFKPYLRFPFLMGEDALGQNYYLLNYFDDFSFTFGTKLLNSLNLAVSNFEEDNQRSTELSLDYPLYSSKLSGLSSLNLGYSTDFDEDSNPKLAVFFSYPRQDISLSSEVNLKVDDSINTTLNYRYTFNNSSLAFKAKRYDDFDSEESIRAFDSAEVDEGYQLSADYIHKLTEVRSGSWSPNIFLGDIYGSVFIDYAHELEDDNHDLSGGYEFLVEMGLFNYLSVVPRLGVTTDGQEVKGYLGVKMDL
ncbi:hypothetical protein SAMN06265827_10692 [Orenia metallireducens]|jgi:hypothetical protein|uniref:WD40-like Beta Propeller Repeat n=1 Tax=Orenia metallireducens TaxID=1413210 RepID=A0A285GBT5_9FIRM|nr:hypothetical protein [Orenia metallireducens]SNY21037.1 hypothetical protein SAMN06265827_10692 [Orenia metallireducens]